MIAEGKKVSIEYSLRIDDGTTVDSNVGQNPLVYTQGSEAILPALESKLAELGVGEGLEITLSPEDGYGSVDPDLFQSVEQEAIPEDARHAGAQLIGTDPDGGQQMFRVREVSGENVILDLNHPLAGENLHFTVKILSVD